MMIIATAPAAPRLNGLRIAAKPGGARPTGGLEEVGVRRGGHHERPEVVAPAARPHSVFHRPPDPTLVHHDRHRRTVVLAVIDEQPRTLVLGHGPGDSLIAGAADHDIAMLLAGPMNEFALSGEVDILIKKLTEKGILSESEAKQIITPSGVLTRSLTSSPATS